MVFDEMDLSTKVSLVTVCNVWLQIPENTMAVKELINTMASVLPANYKFGGNDLVFNIFVLIGMGVILPLLQNVNNQRGVAFVMRKDHTLPKWVGVEKFYQRLCDHVEMILEAHGAINATNNPTVMLDASVEKTLELPAIHSIPQEPIIDMQHDVEIIRRNIRERSLYVGVQKDQ